MCYIEIMMHRGLAAYVLGPPPSRSRDLSQEFWSGRKFGPRTKFPRVFGPADHIFQFNCQIKRSVPR